MKMGCKYSKVIPRGKQEERVRSSKSRREELNKVVVTANANRRDLSTEEILDDLYTKGIINNPKKRGGGVAFDIGQTDLPPKPPRRLEEIKKPEVDIMYTAEERALVAEILRKHDAKEMGWKRDLKQDKAKSRRMLKETETKAKVENKRKRYDQRMDEMDKKMEEDARIKQCGQL